ncbi:MAG: hypothetical protein K8R21_11920 [Leptospira sp.]|nr:hypothetical protein [Leptospira sp.]
MDNQFWDIKMFYPNEGVLAFSDPFILQGLFILLFTKIFGFNLILSLEIMFCIFLLLNWFFASIFISEFITPPFLFISAGWLWAFSDFMLFQTSGHLQNSASFGIPFVFFFFYRQIKSKKWNFGNTIGIAIGLVLLSCGNLYNLTFTVLSIPLVWLAAFLFSFNRSSKLEKAKKFLELIGSVFLGIILSLPVILPYFRVRSNHPEFFNQRSSEYLKTEVVHLANFFTGPMVTPLFKNYFYDPVLPERSQSPGTLTFFFFISAICIILFLIIKDQDNPSFSKYVKKHLFFPVSLLAFSLFIASGYLLSPSFYEFATDIIPGLRQIRCLGRVGILLTLSEIIILFLILNFLFQKRASGSISGKVTVNGINKLKIYRTFILFIILLLILEKNIPGFSGIQTDLNPIYQSGMRLNSNLIKLDREEQTPILEINLDQDNYLIGPLGNGLSHNFPIVNGYSGYYPDSHREYFNMNKFLKGNFEESVGIKSLFEWAGIIILYFDKTRNPVGHIRKILSDKHFSMVHTETEYDIYFKFKK